MKIEYGKFNLRLSFDTIPEMEDWVKKNATLIIDGPIKIETGKVSTIVYGLIVHGLTVETIVRVEK